MINLPDVTLLAISSIEILDTVKALTKSSRDINFGAVKLLSHERPSYLPTEITWESCPRINNIMDFNNYVFFDLTNHVQTSHCLMVQYHGYIINPSLWNDDWLNFDYIGAPWPYREDSYIYHETGEHIRVGNGGFSLRSKKLLDIPTEHNLSLLEEQGYYNEDGNLTIYHRTKMLELGIKYAPLETACIFSYETSIPENKGVKTFGYHRNCPSNYNSNSCR